jgi:hypothetical protein
MITYVVPSSFIFGFAEDTGGVRVSMSYDLREHLLLRLFDNEYEHLGRACNRRLLTFDNIVGKETNHCRIAGWISSSSPRKVVKIARQNSIDVIRDLFEAYPLFAESFAGSYFPLEGLRDGVFSSGQ